MEERDWTYNSTIKDSSGYICAYFPRDELQTILDYAETKDVGAEMLMKGQLRDLLSKEG